MLIIGMQKVFENINNKNVGGYHDFYFQTETLLFVDVFENFRNVSIEICYFDPAHILSARQACSKKIGIKLELLADVNM